MTRASRTAISPLSSTFTKMRPAPSVTPNSSFPPIGIVPATVPSLASITVTSPLRPLKAKTRWVRTS